MAQRIANINKWIMETQEKLGEEIEAISLMRNDETIYYEGSEIEKALKRCDIDFELGFGCGCEAPFVFIVWFQNHIMIEVDYDYLVFHNLIPRNPDKDFIPSSYGTSNFI